MELGAMVMSPPDSIGSIVTTGDQGISMKNLRHIIEPKKKRKQLHGLKDTHKDGFSYIEVKRAWKNIRSIDIALPSATQNEL